MRTCEACQKRPGQVDEELHPTLCFVFVERTRRDTLRWGLSRRTTKTIFSTKGGGIWEN